MFRGLCKRVVARGVPPAAHLPGLRELLRRAAGVRAERLQPPGRGRGCRPSRLRRADDQGDMCCSLRPWLRGRGLEPHVPGDRICRWRLANMHGADLSRSGASRRGAHLQRRQPGVHVQSVLQRRLPVGHERRAAVGVCVGRGPAGSCFPGARAAVRADAVPAQPTPGACL